MTTQADCSLGISVAEASYGTITTPTRSFEFIDESLDWNPTFIQGAGLRAASRFPRRDRRALGKQGAGGDINVELASKGHGIFFLASMGAVTSTQRATTGVYQHNFTPATTDYLNSYTLQKGIPPLGGGAALPHTLPGSVCQGWELTAANGDFAKLKSTWNSKSIGTATALAGLAYPTPLELFTFVKGAITIGGTVTAPTTIALATGGTAVTDIVDCSVAFENNLDDAGFNLGGAGSRVRKPALGLGAVHGSLTAEFDTATLRDAYLGQLDLALVLTFQGLTVIGTGSDVPALQVYVPGIRLEGDIPNSNGGQVIQQSVDWTGLDNLTNPPVYVSYVTLDTLP